MKERPILFQGAMVRALLAGMKTQTRRAVKWRGLEPGLNLGFSGLSVERSGSNFVLTSPTRTSHEYRSIPQPCPYGQTGDRLWVRETWGYRGRMWSHETPDEETIFLRYRADDPQPELMRDVVCGRGEHDANLPKHRARHDGEGYDDYHDYLTRYWAQWRPAIHMPRWACRITLEVTGVRVERLQAISHDDACAEGIESTRGGAIACIGRYRTLWERINGAGSWDANPWVWVVEFRRLTS